MTGEFGSLKPGNESLPINNCITCHIGKIKSYKDTPLMPKDHLELLRKDSPCINCHRDTGHETGLAANDVDVFENNK
ncbi:hypothetical protein DOT_4805 [Desulfosporosinus sp. OT]|nr:hypothetical protein DOT_4805 [Desulfosporosinus sp. OT]